MEPRANQWAMLLLVSLLLVGLIPIITPSEGQTTLVAYIRVVTQSFKRGPGFGEFSTLAAGLNVTGVANSYYATNTCVEIWREFGGKLPTEAELGPAQRSPDKDGTVKLALPSNWENVTLVIKAKNARGKCITGNSPYAGLVVYLLKIGATNETFRLGGYYGNRTYTMKGEIISPMLDEKEDKPEAFNNTGPADFLFANNETVGKYRVKAFAANHSAPANAWAARTAYIFKQFHVHSWYSIRDNLSHAQIKVYEIGNVTDPTKEESLLAEAVTSGIGDGLSRWPVELFPANTLVPIPLMVVNPRNGTPFHGGVGYLDTRIFDNGVPHLNATVRVYWNYVLVAEQDYIGEIGPATTLDPSQNEVNATYHAIKWPTVFLGPDEPDAVTYQHVPGMDQYVPEFNPTASLSLWHNYTFNDDTPVLGVTNFLNATVFYALLNVTDADDDIDALVTRPGHPDPLIGATFTINLLTGPPQMHVSGQAFAQLYGEGFTNDSAVPVHAGFSHWVSLWPGGSNGTLQSIIDAGAFIPKHPGILPQHGNRTITSLIRFPNATTRIDYINVTRIRPAADPELGFVGQLEYMYDPSDATNKDAITNFTLPLRTSYLDTKSLDDDKKFGGLGIEIKYKGGTRNSYGGTEALVNYTYLSNPYAYSIHNSTWIDSSYPLITFGYGAKHLNITASVYDLQLIVANDFGAPVIGAAVTLKRTNGQSITLTTAFLAGFEDQGPAVRFYQLPGQMPEFAGYPAGFSARYEISSVVEGVGAVFTSILEPEKPEDFNLKLDSSAGNLIIEPLKNTTFIKAKAATYKAKIVLTDCSVSALRNAAVWLTHPTFGLVERQVDASGGVALDGPTGIYGVKYITFKRTYVAPVAVIYPDGKVVLGGDVNITRSFQPDIVVRFAMADLPVVTYDFDADVRIPYLNVTLSWTSALATNTEAPDGSGDGADGMRHTDAPWNTTATTTFGGTPPPFGYDITYRTREAKTTFTQMPGREFDPTTGTSKDIAYSVKITTAVHAGALNNDTSRTYGTTYRTPGYAKWTVNRLVQNKPLSTNATTDGTVFKVGTDGTCSFETSKLTTWAMNFDLQVLNGAKRLADAEFAVNAHFARSQLDQSNRDQPDQWQTIAMTDSKSKSDVDVQYRNTDIGSALTAAAEPKSDALYWWNSTYRLTSLKFKAALDYNIAHWFNASATPNKVLTTYNFILTPESSLTGKTVKDVTYWPWPAENAPYVYEYEVVKPELPVGDIVLTVKDRGHTPLPGATIRLAVFDHGPIPDTSPIVWIQARSDSQGSYNFTNLPTHDWFSETQAVDRTFGIFNYTISVFFDFGARTGTQNMSARVFYESFNLTKLGYRLPDGGAVEVYKPTFYLSLSNSTLRPIKGLNVTVYYINQTDLSRVYLTAFGSGWRTFPENAGSTGASEVWADGSKKLTWVPGPKYMNASAIDVTPSAYTAKALGGETLTLNFSHSYFFRATHADIEGGTVNLLSTGTWGFVLNNGANETLVKGEWSQRENVTHLGGHYFGGPASNADIDVPIAANASDVAIVAVTWRDENLVPVAYPIQNYLADVTLSGIGTSATVTGLKLDDKGVVHFRSDTSDPKKVVWGGTKVKVKVYPPADRLKLDSTFYSDWLRQRNVDFVNRAPLPIPESIDMVGAVNEIEKTVNVSFDVSTARSKPFVAQVDYTAVTVRSFDFNGRALAGAYVQIVEARSGRVAGWSYTMNTTYQAKSIVMATLGGTDKTLDFSFDTATGLGTITPRLETTPRIIGGPGYTAVMNVSIPSTETDSRYILRVFWLPFGTTGSPIFPFFRPAQTAFVHINVYNSDADEIDIAAKARLVKYQDGLHVDTATQVFDMRLRFVYEQSKPITVGVDVGPSEIKPEVPGLKDLVAGGGELLIQRVPRATYDVTAWFDGVVVASVQLAVNVGSIGTATQFVADINVSVADVIIEVTDLDGQPLPGAVLTVTNEGTGKSRLLGTVEERQFGFKLPTSVRYVIEGRYTSSDYETSVTFGPSTVTIEKLVSVKLPVSSVTIKVLDTRNKPVAGAEISFGTMKGRLDDNGLVIFRKVPLHNSYSTEVKQYGIVLVRQDLLPTPSRRSFNLAGGLFNLRVQVKGAAGQGLPFATVLVKGPTVPSGSASLTASPEGFAELSGLLPAAYEVEVSYKGFTATTRVLEESLKDARVVAVQLPPYLEIGGIVLTFYTFLAIIIGVTLLIIVLVIMLHEYMTWRRRHFEIYRQVTPKR